MTKYKIYHKADYIGKTVAKSPQQAINNVRWRMGLRFAPMSEFRAMEVK